MPPKAIHELTHGSNDTCHNGWEWWWWWRWQGIDCNKGMGKGGRAEMEEMEEELFKKYHFVRKIASIRKSIPEFTQGPNDTCHNAWEWRQRWEKGIDCNKGMGKGGRAEMDEMEEEFFQKYYFQRSSLL